MENLEHNLAPAVQHVADDNLQQFRSLHVVKAGMGDDVFKYVIGNVFTDDTAKDLLSGLYKEVTEHPVKLGVTAAIAGAANVAMHTFLGPKAKIALCAVGAVAGIYELGKSAVGLAENTAVLKDETSTEEQKKQAHEKMQKIGAGTADGLAAFVGGAASNEGMRLTLTSIGYLEGESALPSIQKAHLKLGAILGSYELTFSDLEQKLRSK